MADMRVERRTVDLSEYPDLVVIYLGMRVNALRGLKTVAKLGPQIRDGVKAEPDGLLLHEDVFYSLRHIGMREYWRDLESLERWTRSEPHKIWWRDFLKDSGGTAFWHETYFMRGGMEAIYDDLPKPLGLQRVRADADRARRDVQRAAAGEEGSGGRGPRSRLRRDRALQLDRELGDELAQLGRHAGELLAAGGDLLGRRARRLLGRRRDLLGGPRSSRSRRWRPRRSPPAIRATHPETSSTRADSPSNALAGLGDGRRRRLGELAHLVGDDREAAALLAGAGGLDGGVERQQVGLVGDRRDLRGQARRPRWATRVAISAA